MIEKGGKRNIIWKQHKIHYPIRTDINTITNGKNGKKKKG